MGCPTVSKRGPAVIALDMSVEQLRDKRSLEGIAGVRDRDEFITSRITGEMIGFGF
jgi:hypothetical protein